MSCRQPNFARCSKRFGTRRSDSEFKQFRAIKKEIGKSCNDGAPMIAVIRGSYTKSGTLVTLNTASSTDCSCTGGYCGCDCEATTVTYWVTTEQVEAAEQPTDQLEDSDALDRESRVVFAAPAEPGRKPSRNFVPHRKRPSHRIRGPPAECKSGSRRFGSYRPAAVFCGEIHSEIGKWKSELMIHGRTQDTCRPGRTWRS